MPERNYIILLFLMVAISWSFGQKVGINNTNPSEELDVTGNINVTGEIKVDGSAGQSGQMLSSNGDGTMQWANTSDYKFFEEFNSSDNWIVPVGVNQIMVELWGGGGGGGRGGGGGAGTYMTAKINFSGVSQVFIVVGVGGAGGSATGSFGTSTMVTLSGLDVLATGGEGSGPSTSGAPFFGSYAESPWFNVREILGTAGDNIETTFTERTAGTFVYITKGGNGGDSVGFPNSGGRGGNSQTAIVGGGVFSSRLARPGYQPGAGGGGGAPAVTGGNGADGQVIIYWN